MTVRDLLVEIVKFNLDLPVLVSSSRKRANEVGEIELGVVFDYQGKPATVLLIIKDTKENSATELE